MLTIAISRYEESGEEDIGGEDDDDDSEEEEEVEDEEAEPEGMRYLIANPCNLHEQAFPYCICELSL